MPQAALLYALDGARNPVPVLLSQLSGGGGGGTVDIDALSTAIADKIALKTLAVSGETVDETALSTAIANAIALKTLNIAGETVDEVALATAVANAIATKDLKAIGYTPPVISQSFTRPADTTAYAQNDIISNSTSATTPLAFPVARVNGGTGYLNTILFQTNNPAWTNAQLVLWLYRAAPTNVATDNNPFTLLWANRDNLIGSVSLSTFATGGAGSDSVRCFVSNLGIQFGTMPDSQSIFALIQNVSSQTLTPVSGQGFHIQLRVEQN